MQINKRLWRDLVGIVLRIPTTNRKGKQQETNALLMLRDTPVTLGYITRPATGRGGKAGGDVSREMLTFSPVIGSALYRDEMAIPVQPRETDVPQI